MTVSAIICADLHLRDTQPLSRIDNYMETQKRKLLWLKQLQKKHNDCCIFCAGDLFDKAKSSNYLLRFAIKNIPHKMIVIPGQHDLPNHSIDKLDHSSLGVLQTILFDSHNSIHTSYADMYEFDHDGKSIGMIHTFIQKPNDDIDKKIGGVSALTFLKKYKDLDIIITGDNHKSFVVEHKKQLLVNPGSMMRSTAAQKEHKPCVYLWDHLTNTVVPEYFPIEKDVFDFSHLEIQEKKDDRIQSFIKRINTNYEIDISFEKNLEKFFLNNHVRKSVKEIIYNEV